MSSALSKGAVQKVQFTRERELFDQLSSICERFQQLLRSELELNCYTPSLLLWGRGGGGLD
jgi:hypothetical protein